MTPLRLALGALLAAGVLPTTLTAQFLKPDSYRDLELVRSRPRPYDNVFRVRGAAAYTRPNSDDEALGLETDLTGYGSVFVHASEVGDGQTAVTGYAGTDGIYAGIRNMYDPGSTAILEVSSRLFAHYREGFYQSDRWVPTGQYDGQDYGAYLGLATSSNGGYHFEVGPFYRLQTFSTNDVTQPNYVIPEDYNTYGVRVHFEQSTLRHDRATGRPDDGFVMSVRAEYELNDSDTPFGTDLWMSTLPDGFLRGWGHLEWYFPTGGGTWEFLLDGGVADIDDRVYVHDAQKPIGHYWADTQLGFRLGFDSLAVTPYANLQFTATSEENGANSSNDIWYGGGLRMRWDLGDSLAIWGEYSYLNNPNRPTISFLDDAWGQQQMFLGLELTFGGS